MDTLRRLLIKPWIYIIIVLIGTLLKFYQLGNKQFWMDEVASVLYTTGLKGTVILNQIPVNQIKSISYYDTLLHPNKSSYPLKSEIKGILSDTHLTPAHYIFLTFWSRLMGDDALDYRLFSVFMFILSLPFLFLLAKTLFDSDIGGWIAISLFAVSPFIHYEAQEARYYTLWIFFFILSNYFFLQGVKHQSVLWWIAYAIAAVLAIYTSALSVLYIIGHFIYIFLFHKSARIKFGFSLLFIVLAYLPWAYFLFTVRETIRSGLAWHVSDHISFFSLELIFVQLLGFLRSFMFLFDHVTYFMMFIGLEPPGIYTILLIDLILLVFVLYAIYYLLTSTSKEKKWFLILLMLPVILFLYLSDIFRNGFTSLLWRYQIVNMIGISLVVTNLLQHKIREGKVRYMGLYFALVIIGLTSIWKIAATRCWNTSPVCESNVEEAQFISQAINPLLITDFNKVNLANFLTVINDSRLKNADIIYCKEMIPDIKEIIKSKTYSDVFVMHASDTLAAKIQSQFGERMIPYRKDVPMFAAQLWHIKNP